MSIIRAMALDYGEKTIGVAISDPLAVTAQGLEVIFRDNEESIKKSIFRLKELIKQYDVSLIVLGYPKNLDNSISKRCEKTLLFKERLERNFKSIPVVLWDERLSTVGASRNLTHLSKKERDMVIDKMAAVFILQGFMEANRHKLTVDAKKKEEKTKGS